MLLERWLVVYLLFESGLSLATNEPRVVYERRGVQQEMEPMKVHPNLSGDIFDLCIGAACGGICGGLVSMAIQKVANAMTLIASNLAFTICLLKFSQSQGFVTIHSDRIRTSANELLESIFSLPILRKIDLRRRSRERGDKGRRRTQEHLYRRKSQPRENMNFLQLLTIGGFDHLEELATSNEHAVLGLLVGFVFGFLRAAGVGSRR